jgi:hypothetical protein
MYILSLIIEVDRDRLQESLDRAYENGDLYKMSTHEARIQLGHSKAVEILKKDLQEAVDEVIYGYIIDALMQIETPIIRITDED